MQKRPFVLSGGGARGFAHIGVLKAFAEFNIVPEAIAATSAGAIVGALAACGYTADELTEMTVSSKFFTLFSRTIYKSLKLPARPLVEFLTQHLRYKKMEELPLPLYIAATNLVTCMQEVFTSGDIIPAVIAACSVPMVFPVALVNNIPYADGGMSGNLPVEPLLQAGYKNIIGVYVNPLPPYSEKASLNEATDRMLHLMINDSVQRSMQKCALVIQPPALAAYRMFEEKKKKQIIDEGYGYTKGVLGQGL